MGNTVNTYIESGESTEGKLYVVSLALTGITLAIATIGSRLSFYFRNQGVANDRVYTLLGDIELMDKIIWASVLVLAAVLIALNISSYGFQKITRFSAGKWIAPAAVITLFIGLIWVEPLSDFTGMWFGFGAPVTLASLLLAPFLSKFTSNATPTQISIVALIGSAFIVLAYVPLVIQPTWGLAEPIHSRYVYNEILGPTVGNFALAETVPQYTSILGLPLMALSALPSSWILPNLALIASVYISSLAVLAMGLLGLIGWKVLPPRFKLLGPTLTIPLAFVKSQPATTDTGSISTMLSAVPVRTLPLFIVALYLLKLKKTSSLWTYIPFGFTLGLVLLNNFEFGLVCVVASLIVVGWQVGTFKRILMTCGLLALSALSPIALYLGWLASSGHAIHPEYWTLFTRNFWQGFDNLPMPWASAHYFILAILVAGSAVGSRILLVESRVQTSNTHRRNAALISMFFGLAGLGSFGYFVGRSVVSTQLQIFLCFAAPVIAGLTTLLLIQDEKSKPRIIQALSIRSLAISLPAAVALVAILQAPDVGFEWRRVIPDNFAQVSETKYADEISQTSSAIDAIRRNYLPKDQTFVMAVENGNMISGSVGIKNISPIDAPFEAGKLSSEIKAAFCSKLALQKNPILVQQFFTIESGLCPGFKVIYHVDAEFDLIERT